MPIATGLEGRYALAVFALAREGKALDKVAKDLDGLAKLAASDGDFANLLKNPVLDEKTQAKAIAAIAKKAKLHKLTTNLLGVLVENRRLGSLEKVAASFAKICAEYKGEVTAEVVSAEKLSKAQMDALKKQLKRILGQDIAFDFAVDPELLGGLKVKVGSRVIDTSLKTKLETLTLAMKGV